MLFRQARHPVDRVDGELETVNPVEHGHIEGRRGGALLLVAADVQALPVGPPVRQLVDQGRIAVVGENDGLVRREDPVEVPGRQAVRVFAGVLEPHQVHHVDHPDLQSRGTGLQQFRGGDRLDRGHVPGAGQHDVGFLAGDFGAGELPDSQAALAVVRGVGGAQPGRRGLLAADHDVDVVP